jgi:site-specific DNA-methyltransferase (adenine-specific)
LAEKTVAANVLEHGTGALNIDGCRVEAPDQSLLAKNWDRESIADMRGGNFKTSKSGTMTNRWGAPTGRFPAHLIHDGSEEVLACFGKGRSSGVYCAVDHHDGRAVQGVTNFSGKGKPVTMYGDSGSAARFFYCAKASKRDRDEGLDGFELKKNDFHRESSGLNQDQDEKVENQIWKGLAIITPLSSLLN